MAPELKQKIEDLIRDFWPDALCQWGRNDESVTAIVRRESAVPALSKFREAASQAAAGWSGPPVTYVAFTGNGVVGTFQVMYDLREWKVE